MNPLRPPRLSLAGLALATVALVTALTPSAEAAPVYPVADPDPFYAAPADLAASAPGDVLRTRTVPRSPWPGTTVWQLLFRSTDSGGAPIAAVTTLISPGAGPRPLLSYQPFVNSLGLQCAPSHTLFTGALQEARALELLLARGWAVTVPDHLGPAGAYGAARLGGQITLDGIRAVRRFAPAGLHDSPVGLAGYSGGAMSTGFAAALAPEYAPELPIVGVAQGGLPVDPGELAARVGDNPNPLFGLGFAVAVGLQREYPDRLPLDDLLTPAGLALRDRIADACTDDIISAGAGHHTSEYLTTTTLAADTGIAGVLHDNALEAFPGTPRAPIYQWHGADDQVPLDRVRATVARYCAAGTPVRLDVIPGADHGAAILPGTLRAVAYLADRFDCRPAPVDC
ncbi:lipase family protein [Nocardia aurantia]|uniref:Putative inactive lipase n=1 Tax=Nocardia aurantia TaxID=2585199 RepID=A0A7K0DPM9_9NOCA|nr:lipase family protein [Nocardia aurantia]MQY26774.1 putative inactive lipase [Nocardia aurantia]